MATKVLKATVSMVYLGVEPSYESISQTGTPLCNRQKACSQCVSIVRRLHCNTNSGLPWKLFFTMLVGVMLHQPHVHTEAESPKYNDCT